MLIFFFHLKYFWVKIVLHHSTPPSSLPPDGLVSAWLPLFVVARLYCPHSPLLMPSSSPVPEENSETQVQELLAEQGSI